jgi:hypothetical protein
MALIMEASDTVFYTTRRKIEAKTDSPLGLAEGVCWAATLNSFKYTYSYFIMHGMQFLLILTRFADVPCSINIWLSYTCVQ